MIQFYAPELSESLFLSPEESHHCVKVLRKRTGDIIYVTDGKGTRGECRIIIADTRGVKLELLSKTVVPKNWKNEISLAVAPTKNADRMAWLVEKATEIGLDRILFINCRNSERKNLNVERLRRNALSAMNQSLKAYLPKVEEMVRLEDILTMEGEKYFGYCDSEINRKEFVKTYESHRDVLIAIGPEGDFSKEEVMLMKDAGFTAVTFGAERLRTETAALYSVAAVHVIDDLNN